MSRRERQHEIRERERREYESSDHTYDKNWRKKRKILIFLEVFLVLAVVIIGGGYIYLQHRLDQTMGNKVNIFGIDVSLMPMEEAAKKIEDRFGESKIVFEEQGSNVFETSFKDAGIMLNHEKLMTELERIKERQGSTKLFGEDWKNYVCNWELKPDEEKERETIKEEHFASEEGRKESSEAYMTYNEDTGWYQIVPDRTGNRINEELLYEKMNEAISKGLGKEPIDQTITVKIDSSVYIPATIRSDDEGLNAKAEKLNAKIQNYLDSTVTYEFGEQTETIDSDLIRSWILIDGEEISLDEEKIWMYADNLASEYNTLYVPRYLESSLGYTVELSNNEYGYWIDTDTEFDQLISDLNGGKPVKREPVYDTRGYQRNGKDDLCGTYVEISIDSQHLWMYKDGELLTETDVVTGQPTGVNSKTKEKESWATCEGAYPLAYKESPSVLSSDIYGYRVEVQYWMPFVMGQGLHDLSSRGAFGGEIYKTNGSHGCVNLPTNQAAYIYEHIEEGYPILIY